LCSRNRCRGSVPRVRGWQCRIRQWRRAGGRRHRGNASARLTERRELSAGIVTLIVESEPAHAPAVPLSVPRTHDPVERSQHARDLQGSYFQIDALRGFITALFGPDRVCGAALERSHCVPRLRAVHAGYAIPCPSRDLRSRTLFIRDPWHNRMFSPVPPACRSFVPADCPMPRFTEPDWVAR